MKFKYKYKKTILYLSSISILLLTGCFQKDLDEFNKAKVVYSPELVAPIIRGYLSIKDTVPAPPGQFKMVDQQTADFPSDDVNSTEGKVDEVAFKILFSNDFPASGTFQVYILDTANIKVDSILSAPQTLIPAGSITTPATNNFEVVINRTRYNTIAEKAHKLLIMYSITTSSGASTFANNKFSFNIGARVKLKNLF
jgi:hypothetical protein